jgi:putative transposase
LVLGVVYLLVRRLVRAAAGSSEEVTRDVELLVLRHQLRVLRRQVGRPRLRRRHRLVLAGLSGALPRARWSSFLVSPRTLLRWHRELVGKKWACRREPLRAGQPSAPRWGS